MNPTPITKLNKRLIYGCLMVTALVAVPLIVIPMTSSASVKEESTAGIEAKAFVSDGNDAFVLSGTEHFPKTYAGVQDFEKNDVSPKAAASEDQLLAAFETLSEIEHKSNPPTQVAHASTGDVEEDPWKQAREAERKRRAFEHYDARRSDIMFAEKKVGRDATRDAVNRTLELAEKQLQQDTSRGDMFFERQESLSGKGPIGKIQEPKPYMVSEGTLIPTILLSEIDTSLPGPILARVSQNIWDSKTGKALLIPQNSQLIGEYNSSIGHGQTRARIVWKRIIFPNQQSVNLGSMVGLDKKGISGAVGSVDNHYDKVALGLVLTTALSGSVRMVQGKYDRNTASMSQEYGSALAEESARLGNKILDKMLSIPPTIKIPMGKRLNVFVEQDLSLQPYTG